MSLRFKVFTPLLLAIIVFAAYIHVFWIPRVLADAENAYQNSVKRHLESVAEGLVPLMLGKQMDAVYGNLDALLKKNSDWVSIRLFEPRGKQFYPFDGSGTSKADVGHGIMTLTQEIRYLDEQLGLLEVGVDLTSRLNEIRKGSTALIQMFLAVLLLILVAIGIILDFIVRKPIRQLCDASQRLANGDFDMRLSKPGNDEVGILVRSFAGMRDAVRTHTERLAEANVQLRREIAERKQAEETLRQTQEELVRKEKLSILGQLSGSVGHELRNPLGVMSNAVYFLKAVQGDRDETTREYLGIIESEIANSERIITDLLDFARTKPPSKKPVTPAALVRQSLERCTIPENVTLTIEVPEELPRLDIDPLQLGQVLINLVTNAVQAMPEGGALRITGEAEKGMVRLGVSDSGSGISPEHLPRLFQPLFTTKPRGIGLGLVVCKNLVKTNGGRIEVASESGKGTTFTLTLPTTREA